MERPWSIAGQVDTNLVAFGFDMGTVVVKLGTDRSVADHNQGRLIYAKNHDMFYANLKAINTSSLVDH